jgi:hypothetical protein
MKDVEMFVMKKRNDFNLLLKKKSFDTELENHTPKIPNIIDKEAHDSGGINSNILM